MSLAARFLPLIGAFLARVGAPDALPRRCLLGAVLLGALGAMSAKAQSLEFSLSFNDAAFGGATQVRAPGARGTRNGFTHDLGHDSRLRWFDLGARWLASPMHLVEAQWSRMDSDGSVQARRDLEFQGLRVPQGAFVESDFDLTQTRVFYRRTLTLSEQSTLALRTGLVFMQSGHELFSSGIIDRGADFSGRFPALGVLLQRPFTLGGLPLVMSLDAVGFFPGLLGTEGVGFEFTGLFEYQVSDHLALQAGYRRFDLRFQPKSGSNGRDLQLRMGGVRAGLALRF